MADDEPASPPWSKLFEGPNAEVWVHEKCTKEMSKDINQRQRAHIEASMEDWYCQMEQPDQVPSSRLNRDEGTRTVNGKEYRAQAFKNVESRVYGVEGSVNNKRAFFAAGAATKKQQKVDPTEVDRAIKRVQDVTTCIKGSKL